MLPPVTTSYRLGPTLFAKNGGVTLRVSEDARKSVVFFAVPDQSGLRYGGTGFLLARKEGTHNFGYLVTAGHVARALEKHEDTGFFIRVNLHNGGSHLEPIQKIKWAYPADPRIDLAVTNFSVDLTKADQIYLQDVLLDFSKVNAVSCGDLISIIGLFRLHVGTKRNVPIVHTGHVAALADPHERIPMRDEITGKLIEVEGYMVEAQTLDGLSGSPVLIEETVNLVGLGPIPGPGQQNAYAQAMGRGFLMGIYVGSWDGEPGKILANDKSFKGNVRVPVGMGIVISIKELISLIEGDEGLKKTRKDFAEQAKAQHAATTDAVLPPPSPIDAEPSHQDRFKNLLNEAAKKREQGD